MNGDPISPVTTIRFVVAGPPVPKMRARTGKGFHFTPARSREYERRIAAAAMGALPRFAAEWRLNAVYSLTCRIYFPDARKRDLDNVIKSIADGSNKIIWNDDSQVVELHAYGSIDRVTPRVEVEIAIIGNAAVEPRRSRTRRAI